MTYRMPYHISLLSCPRINPDEGFFPFKPVSKTPYQAVDTFCANSFVDHVANLCLLRPFFESRIAINQELVMYY